MQVDGFGSFIFFLKMPFIFERWLSQDLLGVNSSVSLVFTAALAGNTLLLAKIYHTKWEIIHDSVKSYDILRKYRNIMIH